MTAVEKLGKILKSTRKSHGFTQIEFALECGIDKTNLGRIERGEVFIRFDTLMIICGTLGIHVSELLREL